jgi:hypothetical protein
MLAENGAVVAFRPGPFRRWQDELRRSSIICHTEIVSCVQVIQTLKLVLSLTTLSSAVVTVTVEVNAGCCSIISVVLLG